MVHCWRQEASWPLCKQASDGSEQFWYFLCDCIAILSILSGVTWRRLGMCRDHIN